MKVKTTIGTVLLAASLTAAGQVSAATYMDTIEGSDSVMYDVFLVEGPLSTSDVDAITAADTWNDNGVLARDLAEIVGCPLDGCQHGSGAWEYGPEFAYSWYTNTEFTRVFHAAVWLPEQEPPLIRNFTPNINDSKTFAYATEVAAVPLPAAAWLFGSALFGLGMVKRRKA